MEHPKGVHLPTHPLVAHKLTLLRDKSTPSHDFRRILREITLYLGFEASRGLKTIHHPIITPMDKEFEGSKLSESISIIPILRAGLGMSDGLLDLLPRATVHHIGMYRNKNSLMPIQYYNKLPKDHACDIAFICDPCIATANSLSACINLIKKWGAKKIIVIAVIASKLGLSQIIEKYPDIEIYVGDVDEELSDEGMLIPGIGDAGDRQFGTSKDDLIVDGGDKKRSRSDSYDMLSGK